ILGDDLGAWMLGSYGNEEFKTPNLDVLARMGTRFNSCFAGAPMCAASRATLFTGKLPRQHGVSDQPAEGSQKTSMLSDVLAQAGYTCGYAGKWNLGNDAEPGHGFTFAYTLAGTEPRYENPQMHLNGKAVQEQGYLTELITRRATEFLDSQSAQKPFYLAVSYLNPQPPYLGHPPKYVDMYRSSKFETIGYRPAAANAVGEKEMLQQPLENLRKAAGSISALDDQIPVLQAKLRERNLLENTIVVFTSDHGSLLGRHGLWGKGDATNPINMYEEVMRVPLFVSWLGRIPAEAVVPEMVSLADVLPTLCEALEVPAPANLPGRSFLPIAMRKPLPKKQPWRNLVFGHFGETEMARDNRYKLVLRNQGSGPNELYNLIADPGEQTNQVENPEYITVVQRLTKELAEWRKRTS
ncbi:MAG TPA: sulfatase-like hydrolase/transferase, partial [Bryobacteraceae bacterium]|nr:sulfatase-like hydrolase/transferase [Bryobacteraceae bacterium]